MGILTDRRSANYADSRFGAKDKENGEGWTNWLEGIRERPTGLSPSSRTEHSPGCAVLVWLTDGALDIRTDLSGETPT